MRLRSDSKQNEIEVLVHGEDGAFDLIQSLPRLEDGSPKLTKLDTSSVKDFYLVSGLPDVFVSKQDALSAIKKLKKQK